jgi:hypothetical protein
MADKDFKMRIAFACLEDIKKLFFSAFPPEIRDNALAYGLNEQFSKVLFLLIMVRFKNKELIISILRRLIN